MKNSDAKKILDKVQEDYNDIAENFSRTREKIWPEIDFLRNLVSDQEKILDVGCGSGRLFDIFKKKKITYFGVDFSRRLIEIAKRKYLKDSSEKENITPTPTFMTVDALFLPFEDCFFNKVFSIAVLHHIPSKEKRLDFLKELRRVLKNGGEAHITVWNLWQKKYFSKILKSAVKKTLGKTEIDYCDIFIPFGNKERYYHCFKVNELKSLFKEADFKIKEIRRLKRRGKAVNIYIRAIK